MWLSLLAAWHRMQALSALACSVGCAFSGFESLKIALFIQLLTKEDAPLILLGHPLVPQIILFIYNNGVGVLIHGRYDQAPLRT